MITLESACLKHRSDTLKHVLNKIKRDVAVVIDLCEVIK